MEYKELLKDLSEDKEVSFSGIFDPGEPVVCDKGQVVFLKPTRILRHRELEIIMDQLKEVSDKFGVKVVLLSDAVEVAKAT